MNSSVRQSFEFTMNIILFDVSLPCLKTPTVIFTSVLVLMLWTSLFVKVRISLLINAVHC